MPKIVKRFIMSAKKWFRVLRKIRRFQKDLGIDRGVIDMKTIIIRKISMIILAVFALTQILPQGTLYAASRSAGDAVSERTFFERAAQWLKQTEYNKITEDTVRDRNAMLNDASSYSYISKDNLAASQKTEEVSVELKGYIGGDEAIPEPIEEAWVWVVPKGDYDDTTLNYDVEIGSGKDKEYDQSGRFISEVIDGRRHIYVGFTNAGTATIQDALNIAERGDIVIVRGGEYDGFEVWRRYDYRLNKFIGTDSVTLYGGYRDDGIRDVRGSETIINGNIYLRSTTQTEINGFTIIDDSSTRYIDQGGIKANSCKNLTIKNNDITSFKGNGIYTSYCTDLSIENNNITTIFMGSGIRSSLYSPYNTINTTITHNTINAMGSGANGIMISGYGTATVTYNNISAKQAGLNVGGTSMTAAIARYNDISGVYGIHAGYGAYVTAEYNNIKASGIGISARSGTGHGTTRASHNNINAGQIAIYAGGNAIVHDTDNYINGEQYDRKIASANAYWNAGIINTHGPERAEKLVFEEGIFGERHISARNLILTRSLTTTSPQTHVATPIALRREKEKAAGMLSDLSTDLSSRLRGRSRYHRNPALSPRADTIKVDLQERNLQPDFDFTKGIIIKPEGELTRSAQDSFASNMPVEMFNQKTLGTDYALEGIVTDLDNKDDKTLAEEDILEVAKVASEEKQHLDEDILQDFTEKLERTLWATANEDYLKAEGVDLTTMTDALTELKEEQEKNRNTYLADRDTIYKRIEALLIRREILPNDFLVINANDTPEERKLKLDNKLENLTARDLALLTEDQRKDLITDRSASQTRHAAYLNDLTEMITNYMRIVEETLGAREPYSIFRPEEKDKLKVR